MIFIKTQVIYPIKNDMHFKIKCHGLREVPDEHVHCAEKACHCVLAKFCSYSEFLQLFLHKEIVIIHCSDTRQVINLGYWTCVSDMF